MLSVKGHFFGHFNIFGQKWPIFGHFWSPTRLPAEPGDQNDLKMIKKSTRPFWSYPNQKIDHFDQKMVDPNEPRQKSKNENKEKLK